jgi:peptidoglycan hydrolase CwlO-like protein
MGNIIANIICKVQNEKVAELSQEVALLRQKLHEKQEHINATNKYYKKKIRSIRASREGL